jgi:hypothetical protein
LEMVRRGDAFRREAQLVLATHESSTSRIIVIEDTYKHIGRLSLKQDDLFRQSLRCIEHELFRAAHVLAWAALMDVIGEELAKDRFRRLNIARPGWSIGSLDDLRDVGSDYQIVEVVRNLKLCSKTEEKALKGLLNRRNECAHPTEYYPGLSEALGYVSEILQRVETFRKRWS